MRAFHGQQALKNIYLNRLRQHRMAAEIIQDFGWYNGRGGAISCTIHGDSYSDYEQELGIPAPLANLQDAIFQKLDQAMAPQYPEQFLGAIRADADLSSIWPQFAARLLGDQHESMIAYALVSDSYIPVLNEVELAVIELSTICRDEVCMIETWDDAALKAGVLKVAATKAYTSDKWNRKSEKWALAVALNAADAALSVANSMKAICRGILLSSRAADCSVEAAGWAYKASLATARAAHCLAEAQGMAPEAAAAQAYVKQSTLLLDLLQKA